MVQQTISRQKSFKMFRLLLLTLLISHSTSATRTTLNKIILAPWEIFKKSHNKQYDAGENLRRNQIFEQNYEKIIKHNMEQDKGLHTYKLGINKYADMTTPEVTKLLNGFVFPPKASPRKNQHFQIPEVQVPLHLDWRNEGLVTQVQDQAHCGACWAFSASGSLEGQWAIAHGGRKWLVPLSEQQLMDCSNAQGNNGCDGGSMEGAFEHIKLAGGLDKERCYPFKKMDGRCQFRRSCIGATLKDYVFLPEADEGNLQRAVATVGPVSVAVDASHLSFHLYDSGIYDEPHCSTTALDHAMLLVGYGTENGKDYWIVKNSFGRSWGEDGYIRMSRNKRNQCGIASYALYPRV